MLIRDEAVNIARVPSSLPIPSFSCFVSCFPVFCLFSFISDFSLPVFFFPLLFLCVLSYCLSFASSTPKFCILEKSRPRFVKPVL